eukprot:gene597-1016_t
MFAKNVRVGTARRYFCSGANAIKFDPFKTNVNIAELSTADRISYLNSAEKMLVENPMLVREISSAVARLRCAPGALQGFSCSLAKVLNDQMEKSMVSAHEALVLLMDVQHNDVELLNSLGDKVLETKQHCSVQNLLGLLGRLRRKNWSIELQKEIVSREESFGHSDILPLALRVLQCPEVIDETKIMLEKLGAEHVDRLKLAELVDLACVFKRLELKDNIALTKKLLSRLVDGKDVSDLHVAELLHLCDGLSFLAVDHAVIDYSKIGDAIISKLAVLSTENSEEQFGLRPMEAEGFGSVLALPEFDNESFLRNLCPLMSFWPANVTITAFESFIRVAELKDLQLGLFPDFVLESVSRKVDQLTVNLVCRIVNASASPKATFQDESRSFFVALASGLPSLSESLKGDAPELSSNEFAMLVYRLERLVSQKDELRAPYLELAGTVDFSSCDANIICLLLSAYTSVSKNLVGSSKPQVLEGFFDSLCKQLCTGKLNAHELHIVLVAMTEVVPKGYSSDPMLALVHHIVRFLPQFTDSEPSALEMSLGLLLEMAKSNEKVKEILVRFQVLDGENTNQEQHAGRKERMRNFILDKASGVKTGASHKKLQKQNVDPVEEHMEQMRKQSNSPMSRALGWVRKKLASSKQ